MESVIIYDHYNQPWKIQEGDPLYAEAKAAVDNSPNDMKIYWPLDKLAMHRGWGWWTVFKNLDSFEQELRGMMDDPYSTRLYDWNKEYTPVELRDLLQKFGSHLATLHRLEGRITAQCVALKQGYQTGIKVALTRTDSRETTVSGREAEILANNDLFSNTKKIEIDNEALLEMIKGWRNAYQIAWETVSRIITLSGQEVAIQTSRHN